MDYKPIMETISYLLAQVCKTHRGCANDALADIGLHAGQEMFLLRLWGHDGQTQSQLVEQLHVQPATISKMLDRLELAGLVERRPDAEDNRVSRVYLTDASRSLEGPVCSAWNDLEERTVTGLTLEERILLRRLLLQVLQNLSGTNPSP